MFQVLLRNVVGIICLLQLHHLSTLAQSLQQGNGCPPQADVIFLLDGSDSISGPEFQQQIELITRFVNNTNIGNDAVRLGFAVVSSKVEEEFPLFASINKGIVMAGISNLSQPQEGSRTDLGLVQMEQMFGFQGRPGVLRIGVVMTDGRAKFERATEVEASVVKNSGIFLIAIGVGRLIKFSELEKIASTVSNAYRLVPLDVSSALLSETVEILGRESCAGHAAALLDMVKSGTNPNAVQNADMPFRALSDKIRQETGNTHKSNADPLSRNAPFSIQPNIDVMGFPEKHAYDVFNASAPLPQPLGPDVTPGSAMLQFSETTTTTAAPPVDVTAPFTYTDPPLATGGFQGNFNGGNMGPDRAAMQGAGMQPGSAFATEPSPFSGFAPEPLLPSGSATEPLASFGVVPDMLPTPNFRPESLASSGFASEHPQTPDSTFGVALPMSGPNSNPPVPQEMIAPNAQIEKQPIFAQFEISTPSSSKINNMVNGDVAIQDECSKGRYVNGVGHTFVPNSCTDFKQCIRDNGKVHVELARCPFETFFDDKNGLCKYYEDTMCWRDPCLIQPSDSYPHPGNCRAYWSCASGSSVPMCCPLGSSFNPGIGCTRNIACQDTCMDFGNINTVITATKCRLLPMETNDRFFFEKVSGLGWMVRACPPGSRFDAKVCSCSKPDKVFKPSCRPELYLTFEDGVTDSSGNQMSMGNTNVRVDLGSGQFDGNSHLTLWRFSGVSFGQKLKITFRFRTSVWAPKGLLMHIVSNCCYGCGTMPQPSVNVAIIPGDNGGIAVFSASTTTAGEQFVYVHFEDTFTGWNRLTYTYDGRSLTGTVNAVTESKSIIGDIQSRPHPLMIGACDQTGAFQGYLDDFEFYMCTAA